MRINKSNLISGQTLEFGDFNVFIGGNGVGKTTLVTELFHKSTERQREKYRWVDSTEVTSNDINKDL